MNRKNAVVLSVVLLAALAVYGAVRLAWHRGGSESEPIRAQVSDVRPSPVAESVDITVRKRQAPQPIPAVSTPILKAATPPEPNRVDNSVDWSVIAATLNTSEQAERRAQTLKSQWKDCACTVFPKGESAKYFVVVGADLDRVAADRLRDRAAAAGLPPDTYVTKLIRAGGADRP